MPAARRSWTLLEPVHAVTYFAPQARAATEALGLRGYWRGYFAGRLCPLGAVEAAPATAVLFGFAPAMVARGVPEIWRTADPGSVVRARLEGVDGALRSVWDVDDPRLARTAELLRRATDAAPGAGRVLFAANTALPWPEPPHLAVWHGCTLLREHRGDGHVAALTAAGLDGCEALVSHVAGNGPPVDALQPNRGWTDDEWSAAADRLSRCGWLADGELTAVGAAGRRAIEDATDRAAERGFAALTVAERAELDSLLARFAEPVVSSGLIPYPNAMGVPRPVRGTA